MSVVEDLIDFEIIENQKENIQSLPGGRSARNLSSLFSQSPLHELSTPTTSDTKNLNNTIRLEYEVEIQNISESDDPLDIYDRYVRWTLDAYPSAQATPSSGLLPLLERATKTFHNSAQYKNDPRYLKLWLTYIRFFSETPREMFAFLSRHGIGDGLALFYEEFAAWLEGAGRWIQAEEVYKVGVEKEARPSARLLRKFGEFHHRSSQRLQDVNEPSSPALPTVRPALVEKMNPFSATLPRDPQAARPTSGVVGTAAAKRGRQKLAIFSDADEAAPAIASSDTKGWASIGSLADRKKENVMEPQPWAGETLKAGGKKSSAKMAVFKDESLPKITYLQISNPAKEQVTMNAKGRTERIFIDLESVYPTPMQTGTELSLEELRAAHRGWLFKSWKPKPPAPGLASSDLASKENTVESDVSVDVWDRNLSEHRVIARNLPVLDENGVTKEHSREGRGRRLKIKEVNATQIIKAKLSSPSGRKMTKRKSSKEQTMTLHTRAATDEIYDLFSQPLDAEEEEDESSDDDDADTTDGDYTSGGESTGTGRLVTTSEADCDETSEVKSVTEWSEFTARKHIPKIDGELQDEDTQASKSTTADEKDLNSSETQVSQQETVDGEVELTTPDSRDFPHTSQPMFVPIPPEDYEHPTRPFRDAAQMCQNRLPFMTPIAEKTESSIGLPTVRKEEDYFNSRTPSKSIGSDKPSVRPNAFGSSPFREISNNSRPDQLLKPSPGKHLKTNKTTTVVAKVQSRRGVFASEIALEGPIIKDVQCNPVDDYTRSVIFQNLQPPLHTYEGFFEHQESLCRSMEIKKFAKAVSKMSKNASEKMTTTITMPPVLKFPGTSRQYVLKRELGAGAFAPVYLIENVASEDAFTEEQPMMSKGAFDRLYRASLEALKMEDPPTAWEFYIMRQAKRRLGVSRAAESIVNVYEMHLYSDECYLIEEFRDQGTLLDIINIARAECNAAGPGVMDESLVMFFTVELFRTLEALHAKGILHGDLKADNCLVRLDSLPDSDVWTTQYRKDGTGGWNRKGIALIDFGRGIDMKVFRPDVQFIADWKTGPADCAEMRELRPWTYQIDYHGLAGIVHSMLFGKYIDTVADKGAGLGAATKKSWRIRETLKRYWQTEIWSLAFDLLLNPGLHITGEEENRMPVLKGMKAVRERMEEWLESNSEKGLGLQAWIRKLELAVAQRRK